MNYQEYLEQKKVYSECKDIERKIILGLSLCFDLIQNGYYEETCELGHEIMAMTEEIYDNDHYCRALCLVGIGFIERGEYAKSKSYFDKAYVIAEELHDINHLADIYYYLAVLEQHNSNLHNAYYFALESVRICEENGYFDLLEDRYYRIGTIYADLQKYNLALDYYRKSLRSSQQSDRIEREFMSIAQLYFNIGDFPLALGYTKRAMAIFKKKNDFFYIPECYLLMGGIYLKRGLFGKSVHFTEMSILVARDNDLNNDLVKALLLMGEIYKATKDYQNADQYFKSIHELEGKIENKEILLKFYKDYSDFFKLTGDLRKEYDYYVKYVTLYQEINTVEMKSNLSLKIANYEYEQKSKEVQIFRLKNVELAKSKKIIEEKNNELLRLNETKDNIMNAISHDLKNYIGAIKMALETAIVKDNQLAENKFMKMINTSCDRALNLVKGILYSHKLELSEKVLVLSKQEINQFLMSSEDSFEIRAKQKDIEVKYTYTEKPAYCLIEEEQFFRVIENLFTNALKFTNPGGVIHITVQSNPLNVQIHIKDSGIGIGSENIPKLFDKYSGVGRTGTAGEESTGLGLSIVKKLVELHYGTIEVSSEVGKGTEFIIKIPVATV